MRLVKFGDDYIDPESIEAIEAVASDDLGYQTRISLKSGATFTVRERMENVARKIGPSADEGFLVFVRCLVLVSAVLWFWGIIG